MKNKIVSGNQKSFGSFPGYGLNSFGVLLFLCLYFVLPVFAQTFNQPQYFSPQQNQNYLRNSNAFRQEIARMEMMVYREGRAPLSLTQVPRVQKGDVLKVKLLDEAINGLKLDQTLYDWTLLVAFVNPNRNKDKEDSVSEEINFRKKGWYREHSFTVPFDSQPVFFLYPRPNYRRKIMKLINQNYNEVRKLGEKTIEIAGAYAQIGMFLNELQSVLSGNSYGHNSYGSYGSSGSYGGNYSGYSNGIYENQGYNYNLLMTQSVERLARSFNIQLPTNCWPGGVGYSSGGYGTTNQFGVSPEIVNRLQCVAKNVRLEDFDLSVSRLLQQSGILAASQLAQKYPQLAYWINIAAVAIDFIIKITKKTPLRIVPTVATSTDTPSNNGGYGNMGVSGYQNYSAPSESYPPNSPNPVNPPAKISLFAENQPDDNQFVTAYPIVLHKWQAESDPAIISLRPPVLMEPCLHAGVNLLKSTDLTEDQLSDNFTKDYTLIMSSTNGFKKEFPLKKNIGMGAWELNITPPDLQAFPKIQMTLESVIKGTRGFNEIKSPPFYLPIAIGGNWEITPETQKEFSVGGKRTMTIKNTLGNCQCLQAVIYKPSFGGQFVFEAGGNSSSNQNNLQYSPDGKEVSFEVDATNFQPGAGQIELRTYGGEAVNLNLKLYPLPPNVTNLKIGKGDREAIISGERLEQLQTVKINGRRAIVVSSASSQSYQSSPSLPSSQSSPGYPNQPNSATPQLPGGYIPNLNPNNPNERVIVFEDERTKLTENTVSLELELEDNRIYPVKQTFAVAPARPTIVANQSREIEGVVINNGKLRSIDNGKWIVDNAPVNGEIEKRQPNKLNKTKTSSSNNSQLSTINYQLSIMPVETNEISLNVQNALTDYDFRVENLSIETRLEKNQSSNNGYQTNNGEYGTEIPVPKINFEVLDWKNLKINLQLSEQLQKLLGGRRLQFRIRDRERGDSDWYSIKQTFVRMPNISTITCTNEMNGMCEMKGASIDYISQVSIDGGQTWYPQAPATLQVQPIQDGQKIAMIPILQNKKLLMIKLRDFPKGEGLFINEYVFLNKVMKNSAQSNKPIQPNNQIQLLNHPIQSNGQLSRQPLYPVQSHQNTGNVKRAKAKSKRRP